MKTWNVDFVPRGKRGQTSLRVEGVRATDRKAAIIAAASQERINAADYKSRAQRVVDTEREQIDATHFARIRERDMRDLLAGDQA